MLWTKWQFYPSSNKPGAAHRNLKPVLQLFLTLSIPLFSFKIDILFLFLKFHFFLSKLQLLSQNHSFFFLYSTLPLLDCHNPGPNNHQSLSTHFFCSIRGEEKRRPHRMRNLFRDQSEGEKDELESNPQLNYVRLSFNSA